MVSVTDVLEIYSLLAADRGAEHYELRALSGEMVNSGSTRHEIDILVSAGYVAAQKNKHGLKYFKLLVETKTALKLLRASLGSVASISSEDSRTWWENRGMYGHHNAHCNSFGPRYRYCDLQRAPLAGQYMRF